MTGADPHDLDAVGSVARCTLFTFCRGHARELDLESDPTRMCRRNCQHVGPPATGLPLGRLSFQLRLPSGGAHHVGDAVLEFAMLGSLSGTGARRRCSVMGKEAQSSRPWRASMPGSPDTSVSARGRVRYSASQAPSAHEVASTSLTGPNAVSGTRSTPSEMPSTERSNGVYRCCARILGEEPAHQPHGHKGHWRRSYLAEGAHGRRLWCVPYSPSTSAYTRASGLELSPSASQLATLLTCSGPGPILGGP